MSCVQQNYHTSGSSVEDEIELSGRGQPKMRPSQPERPRSQIEIPRPGSSWERSQLCPSDIGPPS